MLEAVRQRRMSMGARMGTPGTSSKPSRNSADSVKPPTPTQPSPTEDSSLPVVVGSTTIPIVTLSPSIPTISNHHCRYLHTAPCPLAPQYPIPIANIPTTTTTATAPPHPEEVVVAVSPEDTPADPLPDRPALFLRQHHSLGILPSPPTSTNNVRSGHLITTPPIKTATTEIRVTIYATIIIHPHPPLRSPSDSQTV